MRDPQPQDLVLTLLGAYLSSRDRVLWSGGLVRLLGELGFSTAAARMALTRLVNRGLLTRHREGRLVHYRVTPRCGALLSEGDRRILSLGRDPGIAERWTVLWHSIPDELRLERGRLARRLRFLGFGSVQDATWIAARDREQEVSAIVRDLGVAGHVGLMVGTPAASLDFAGFATRAWDLDGLAALYSGFVADFSRFSALSSRAVEDREAFLLRTRLAHAFRRFPFLDPELPADLVPAPAHRREAVSLFHRLYRVLRVPAQRHFNSVATP